MRVSAERSYMGQPVNATDFLAGSGWLVELARTATSRLALVLYRGDGTNSEATFHFFKVTLCAAHRSRTKLTVTCGLHTV
jgi:hypothetical protein